MHAFAHAAARSRRGRRRRASVERAFGNRGAHRGFGHFAHRLVGIGQLEPVQLQVLDVPADEIGQVDQVLVAGEDQLFAVAFRESFGPDRADVLDVDLLDRPGRGEVEARVERARIFADRS